MKRIVWCTVLLVFADSATRAATGALRSGAGESNTVISQTRRQAYFPVADIKVEGARLFTAHQIVELSKLKSRPVAGDHTIAQATERLRRAYANRGFIKARVNIGPDPKSLPDAKQELVDMTIKIDEGTVFRLRRL